MMKGSGRMASASSLLRQPPAETTGQQAPEAPIVCGGVKHYFTSWLASEVEGILLFQIAAYELADFSLGRLALPS